MKFKNIEELVKYIVMENINLEENEISFSSNLSESNIKIDSTKKSNFVNITLNSFSDKPIVEAIIGDENILYVESYEAFKNLCGSGKMTLFGKSILTNICEMDNEAHITLSVDIQEKNNYNVDFKLKLLSEKDDNEPRIQIMETLLNESKTT